MRKKWILGGSIDHETQAIATLVGDEDLLGHLRGEHVVGVAAQRAWISIAYREVGRRCP